MIFKIEPPNPNILSALRYNERKANGEEGPRPQDKEALEIIENGHVVATRNVPEGRTLPDEFDRLKMLSLKARRSGPPLVNSTFHMSVNPASTDKKMSEEKTVELIDRVMAGLGYEKQPYRIYKHTDIPRQHYHVVSIRNGQDGKKINDSFERLKLRNLLRQLSDEYGFEIILNDFEKNIEIRKSNEDKGIKVAKEQEPLKKKKDQKRIVSHAPKNKEARIVPPYSHDNEEPVREQIVRCVEEALTWNFSTFEQLQLLLRKRFNVAMENQTSIEDDRLVFSGTNKQGVPETVFFEDEEFGHDFLRQIKEKLENERMSSRRSQRERLEGLANAAAAIANDYDDFLKLMERKGVWVILSWRSDSGGAFGVTYLDRATKCAWKGSETSVDIAWLKNICEQKGWTLKPDTVKTNLDKRNRLPSRRNTITINPKPDARQKGPGLRLPTGPAGRYQGSNADASRNRDDVLDDEKNRREKPKEYIGE